MDEFTECCAPPLSARMFWIPFSFAACAILNIRPAHHYERPTLKASSTIPTCMLVQVRCRIVSTVCPFWHNPASCKLRSLVDPPALHVMLTATGRNSDMRSIRFTRLLNPCSIVVRPSRFDWPSHLVRFRREELKGVIGSTRAKVRDFVC